MTLAEMAKENIRKYNIKLNEQTELEKKNELKTFVEENVELTTYISETILKDSLEGMSSGILDIRKFNIITHYRNQSELLFSLILWLEYNNIKYMLRNYWDGNSHENIQISEIKYEIPNDENDKDSEFLNNLRTI